MACNCSVSLFDSDMCIDLCLVEQAAIRLECWQTVHPNATRYRLYCAATVCIWAIDYISYCTLIRHQSHPDERHVYWTHYTCTPNEQDILQVQFIVQTENWLNSSITSITQNQIFSIECDRFFPISELIFFARCLVLGNIHIFLFLGSDFPFGMKFHREQYCTHASMA